MFFTVLIYGFYKNGLKFFKLFVPSGIPIFILPLVVFIEVYLVLPAADLALGASVRQHAGGPHRAESVRKLHHDAGAHRHCRLRSAPCCRSALMIALTALELLVAFLQAYVFTILTCIYINDAIHPGH